MKAPTRTWRPALLALLAAGLLSCRPLLNPWDPESPVYGSGELEIEIGGTVVHNGDTVTTQAAVSGRSSVAATVRNIGPGALRISSVTLGGDYPDQYSVSSADTSLQPYHSVTVTVSFLPTTSGELPVLVTIATDDADEGAFSFTVLGTATGG